MKRTISVILLMALLASGAVVSASAKQVTVNVNDISIPFEISDEWYVSTLGDIDPGFKAGNDLTDRYFNRFIYQFGYAIWLKNKKNDNEIVLVVDRSDPSAKDFSEMTDAELNALAAAEQASVPEGLGIVLESAKYRSGSAVFLRSQTQTGSLVNSVYYRTVKNGVAYELRCNSVKDPIGKTSILQQDKMVDDLAAALTFPEDYPSAPETTLPEGVEPEQEEEEIFDLASVTTTAAQTTVSGSGRVTETQTETDTKTTAPQSEPASGTDAVGPSVFPETTAANEPGATAKAGETAEVVTMSEYIPMTQEPGKRPAYLPFAIGGAACVLAAAVAVTVVVIRRRRNG